MITYGGGRRVGQTMKKLIKRLSMQSGGGGGGGGPGKRERTFLSPFSARERRRGSGGGRGW